MTLVHLFLPRFLFLLQHTMMVFNREYLGNTDNVANCCCDNFLALILPIPRCPRASVYSPCHQNVKHQHTSTLQEREIQWVRQSVTEILGWKASKQNGNNARKDLISIGVSRDCILFSNVGNQIKSGRVTCP